MKRFLLFVHLIATCSCFLHASSFFELESYVDSTFIGWEDETDFFVDTNSFDSWESSSAVEDRLQLNGYVRGSLFGGGKKHGLTNAFAEIALQPGFANRNLRVKADLRFREGMFFNEEVHFLDMKELYTGFAVEKFDLTLGNQIVFWGRTDGFNPTNNISPNDLFFLTSEPDDQRLSNFMLRLKYRLVHSMEFDLVAIPFYKPSNYRYDLFDLTPEIDIPGLPSGLLPDLNVGVNFNNLLLPERKLEHGSIGARMNFELPEISFSLSFFSGYDPFHGFDLESFKLNLTDTSNPVQIDYQPKPYVKNTFGADFAIPSGSWIIKGEAAYNSTRNKDNYMYIPNPDFSYVVGVERMWGDLMFIAQYIGKVVINFEPLEKPEMENNWNIVELLNVANQLADYESRSFNRKIFNQQEKLNNAIAVTAQGNFAYETLQAEMTAYYNMTSEELLLRPKLLYKINDSLSFTVGANYMKGKQGSLFGYSSQVLSGAFAELKVMF